MNMSGETLYRVYTLSMEAQGTGVDAWEDLPIEDQNAWEAVANAVGWVKEVI
jgi:hypothetical protein